ncbi:MAG: hypothetical protein HWD58_00535 [Bacteroidota bacterium]|nr:MAG: hypothetical protein HWD58_00535 [Bacteroidota bacterium]
MVEPLGLRPPGWQLRVDETEQRKFHRIEELIDKVVDKMPVPEVLGPAPEYNVKRRSNPSAATGKSLETLSG